MTQPPHGPPQDPQSPYGQPQQPFGAGGNYPPTVPPVTPARQGRGFAIAGIVLAILIWPLGLIVSIIGLVKSRARHGAGKVLSIVGIVISLIQVPTTVFVVVGLIVLPSSLPSPNSLPNSPPNFAASDPGCISAEAGFSSILSTFNSDDNAISRDAGNTSAERADIRHFITNTQTLHSELTTAQAEAQHQSVAAKIGTMNSDLAAVTSGLQAVLRGNTSQLSQLDTAASKLQGDGAAVDSLCSSL